MKDFFLKVWAKNVGVHWRKQEGEKGREPTALDAFCVLGV